LLMFEEDTVGVHDLLYPACSGGQRPGIAAVRPNCRDNMQAALRAVDMTPPEQPELVHPHNLFQNSPVTDLEGHLEIRETNAKPGDYVVLQALDKLVVVVTACSVVGFANGGEPRELLIESTNDAFFRQTPTRSSTVAEKLAIECGCSFRSRSRYV
jgi:aminomethyltransferase